jgi:hypothetical protein
LTIYIPEEEKRQESHSIRTIQESIRLGLNKESIFEQCKQKKKYSSIILLQRKPALRGSMHIHLILQHYYTKTL